MSKFSCNIENTALIIVDMQERLAIAMPQAEIESATNNIITMINGAKALDMPIVVFRQYPQGLGDTLLSIAEHLPAHKQFDKAVFSGYSHEFAQFLKQKNITHVLITGMETHVCVLQTTLDLLGHGCKVHVLADCCISRKNEHKAQGLDFMVQAGAVSTNVEIALFQLIKSSKHPQFKVISGLIK